MADMSAKGEPLLGLRVAPRVSAYGVRPRAVLTSAELDAARSEISTWPGYRATPLVPLPGLARKLGLGSVRAKYEAGRFGMGSFKPLGPPYAMLRVAERRLRDAGAGIVPGSEILAGRHAAELSGLHFVGASSGNHGRAMAWMAQKMGCRCTIFMRAGVSEGRALAMQRFGAKVPRVPGTFDDAFAAAEQFAIREGAILIADSPREDFPDVPRHTIHGYAVLGDEIAKQASPRPTHVFVGAGIGALAAATAAALWLAFGAARPIFVVVEPLAAAGYLASAARGRPAHAEGNLETVMDGLSVGPTSPLAWAILRDGADAFLAIPDAPALEIMRGLARGGWGDAPLGVGESGIAALAGLAVAARMPEFARRLGLGARSNAVAVACEGPTDEAVFRELTGCESAGIALPV
jgi:diaminopropionate ammonia-lyase